MGDKKVTIDELADMIPDEVLEQIGMTREEWTEREKKIDEGIDRSWKPKYHLEITDIETGEEVFGDDFTSICAGYVSGKKSRILRVTKDEVTMHRAIAMAIVAIATEWHNMDSGSLQFFKEMDFGDELLSKVKSFNIRQDISSPIIQMFGGGDYLNLPKLHGVLDAIADYLEREKNKKGEP